MNGQICCYDNHSPLNNANAFLYFLLITEIIFNGYLFTTGAPSIFRSKPHLITAFDGQKLEDFQSFFLPMSAHKLRILALLSTLYLTERFAILVLLPLSQKLWETWWRVMTSTDSTLRMVSRSISFHTQNVFTTVF